MDRVIDGEGHGLQRSSLRALRIAGVVAVLAGLVNAVGDFALRGGPSAVAGAELTLESLAHVPHASIWLGSLLGSLAMPLWLLGLGPVFVGLRPAGFWPASLCVFLFGYGTCAAAYHGAYVLYGSGLALGVALPHEGGVARHVAHLLGHHDDLLAIMTAPLVAASLLFVALALSGRTAFPRWMAVPSPILVPISVSLAAQLPAPWGGVVRPAIGSLVWALFFGLAAWSVWDDAPIREEA